MRCIPNEVRYDYMNALYLLQKSWVVRENATTMQELYKIMQSGGMTKDEFDACYSNEQLENEILEGVIAAQKEFNIRNLEEKSPHNDKDNQTRTKFYYEEVEA